MQEVTSVVCQQRGAKFARVGLKCFRSGMASWMAARQCPLEEILEAGEWESGAVARYIQPNVIRGGKALRDAVGSVLEAEHASSRDSDSSGSDSFCSSLFLSPPELL